MRKQEGRTIRIDATVKLLSAAKNQHRNHQRCRVPPVVGGTFGVSVSRNCCLAHAVTETRQKRAQGERAIPVLVDASERTSCRAASVLRRRLPFRLMSPMPREGGGRQGKNVVGGPSSRGRHRHRHLLTISYEVRYFHLPWLHFALCDMLSFVRARAYRRRARGTFRDCFWIMTSRTTSAVRPGTKSRGRTVGVSDLLEKWRLR